MDKLRLRFEKTGRAVYISHLDLMRTMQRAFSRARLALKYSEGFNPHPLLSILLPLSVGTGSVCELMDFRLREETPLETLPARLTAALPEGIRVTEVYASGRKSAELKWLLTEGTFEYDGRDPARMAGELAEFFAQGQIPVLRKTKRGMGQMDLCPAIREIRFTPEEGAVRLRAVLSAQDPTLNPELLTGALAQNRPELAPDFARFIRIETYDAGMQLYR